MWHSGMKIYQIGRKVRVSYSNRFNELFQITIFLTQTMSVTKNVNTQY